MNKQPGRSVPARWNTPAFHLGVATLVWLVSLVVVNPIGDFPLNDDWSFGLAVRHLLENGDFRPTGWTSMPLITNALWGSLFCLPAGFSFTALRLSTLVASWLGVVGAYMLMKELRQSSWLALVAALTLAVNPIYYALSNTFMTDVPYTTLTIFAAIFFVKHLKGDSNLHLFVGVTIAMAATLSRQLGLAVPLAFAIVLVLQRGFAWRVIVRAAGPAILCVVTLAVFQHWLAVTGRMPSLYNAKNDILVNIVSDPHKLGLALAGKFLKCLLYLGLFLSPTLMLVFSNFRVFQSRKKMVLFGASIMVLAGLTVLHGLTGKGFLMPLSGNITGNIMVKAGIGPLTLRDVLGCEFLPDWLPVLPGCFWLAVTCISLLGAGLFITQLGSIAASLAPRLRPAKLDEGEAAGVFLLLIAAIYLLPFIGGMFDRYLLPVIPLFAAGITSLSPPAPAAKSRLWLPGVALLLAGFFLFSICGTRDYLAWNRTRWQALDDLMKKRTAKPSEIDGGFEFDGYYFFLAHPRYQAPPGKDAWWIEGDTYQITFHRIPGCIVLGEYHYTHWMPPYIGSIFVLKKAF
jgi:hypothetical protein